MGKLRFRNFSLTCGRAYGEQAIAMLQQRSALGLQHISSDPPQRTRTPIPGLWTREQAATIAHFAAPTQSVLWGCDIEDEQLIA